MVNRQQIKFCAVVDLDKTLLVTNSTIELTKFLLKKLIIKKQFKFIRDVLISILKRKLNLITHSSMKYDIVNIFQKFSKISDLEEFVEILKLKINPFVLEKLKSYDDAGHKILIATAAQEIYLPFFIKKLPIVNVDYIGTKFQEEKELFKENRGLNKLKSVEEYLERENFKCLCIISDHYDDIPLYRKYPGINLIVNPSHKTLAFFKSEFPQYIFKKLNNNIIEISPY